LEHERKKNRNLQMQIESSPIEPADKTLEDERFEKLTALMKKERLFTDCNIKRSDIASKIGLSDRGLHDCLKNNIGMSFMEYINHLRLTYACD